MLYITCAALLLVDVLFARHGYFNFESAPGFYIVFGIVAYIVAIMAAKVLRKFVKRNEDYYD
jgi:hypothetical protein